MYFDQQGYDVRCEWGLAGLAACLPGSDVVVIEDVLSFSTSVDIAVGRGGVVWPYREHSPAAEAFAREQAAVLASRERGTGYSLSPASLQTLPAGTRLVVPSPNGSTLSLATGNVPTLAGCLRNAAVVARAAGTAGRPQCHPMRTAVHPSVFPRLVRFPRTARRLCGLLAEFG